MSEFIRELKCLNIICALLSLYWPTISVNIKVICSKLRDYT